MIRFFLCIMAMMMISAPSMAADSQIVTNVATPSAATDAANKAYVDRAVAAALLGGSPTVIDMGAGGGWGCELAGPNRDTGAATTCEATNLVRRACACS